MLRGRHLGWLMWVTSFGRCLTLGGEALEGPKGLVLGFFGFGVG